MRIVGVADVAFDIDFGSRSAVASDQRFVKALEEFGGSTILPMFKQAGMDARGAPRLYTTRPLPEFAAHAWPATVNVVPERSGLVRRYPAGETIDSQFFPSLAGLLAGRYDTSAQSFHLDYGIQAKTIPVYSFVDVLDGTVGARQLKGKKVVIGATAIELGDRFHVPVAGIIAGVELQALAAESILQGRMLAKTNIAVTVVGLAVLSGIMLLIWNVWTPTRQTIALLAFAVAVEGSAVLLQAHAPIIVDTAAWLTAAGTYLVALWLNELDLRHVVARVAQQRFQSIAMSLGDGVVCMDVDGAISFWNGGAKAIFGYGAGEVTGRPFSLLHEKSGSAGLGEPVSLFGGCDEPIELVGVRKNGERFPLEVRFSSWRESDGRHSGAIVRDITARKREEERIRYLAMHDPLTGLANRAQFSECFKEAANRVRESERCAGVLLIDLDNFKEINDTLGHESGDRFLSTFAGQLRMCVDDSAPVARLGGDEFVVLVEGGDVETKLDELVKSIAGMFASRYTNVDGSGFLISATSGAAIYPRDGDTPDELLAKADLALYRAKKEGRGAHVRYHPSFKRDLEQRRLLEAELHRAVQEEEFELMYQPQVRLSDGGIIGAEALIRWRHPVRGLISPGEFLSALNSGNLASAVGTWVLRTACKQGRRWQSAGHGIRVGVNLSPAQFNEKLPYVISDALRETGFSANLLEIEVTENILLNEDDPTTSRQLQRLRNLGVRIAFDDFGTGYASLSYLKRFPLDRLKIDRSFVTDLGSDPRNTAIVAAIVDLGKGLGLSVIAEGVENPHCVKLLREHGCEEGQGYCFGRPMTADEFEHLLGARSDRCPPQRLEQNGRADQLNVERSDSGRLLACYAHEGRAKTAWNAGRYALHVLSRVRLDESIAEAIQRLTYIAKTLTI
ncbi:MAG: EAL domain-containing protein [Rhodospirillales bacterium]|nr:EAL domain-containing protein [Rhodospirillales bacterium]